LSHLLINQLRPPQSTLFPYTTLFRSTTAPEPRSDSHVADLWSQKNELPLEVCEGRFRRHRHRVWPYCRRHLGCDHRRCAGHRLRSEEHTSELQSRENLVCRLLLEKKK